MEKINYIGGLVKDSKVIHISTQTSSSILLNGSFKSKCEYDVRGYLNFDDDESIEYVTVQMPYAVMCNSNYIVNENNNTLVITLGMTTSTYTLPLGNYTASSFITMLKTFLPVLGGWTITLNSITNVFTFANSTNNFTFRASTCDYIIGFTGEVSSVANSLTMPRSCNFLPIPRFIIHCNILNDGVILSTNSSIGASDVLASIPNVSKNNGQIVYENNASEFLVKSQNIGNIVLSITDDNNRLINFNGISSYFVLKFNIFRRSIEKAMRFDNLVDFINKVPISQEQEEQQEL
jgi:hypothetical protein